MEEEPTQQTVGLENMLEATWKRLMEDEVRTLGLYGMGGVGKTTLLEQINNKFLETKDEFHVVISVVVSQDLQIERIQREIGKRLGLCDKEWQYKSKKEKAYGIKKVLTGKRFVMLLDDIWSKVELKEIGIPLPSTENRSKVLFTTRSKEVCGRMGADAGMKVECLEPENAWKLFQQKVRADTLASDPKITELARMVCEKCEGLPLALNVIGETMACKSTVREWQHAVDVLNSNAAEYLEVEEKILKILKFSYDDLKDVIVQQCFQYCALFPAGYGIETKELVEYWLCEGIVNGGGDREKAVNQCYGIIAILVSACLLINPESGDVVTIHDVVRQMALWIASNFGEEKENFVVKARAGLRQMPEVGDWNAVTRMSLHINKIKSISVSPDCSNLTTLFLQLNKLENISGGFFRFMPKLVVLDLSLNIDLDKLPEEVSELVSLRYLSLERTKLEYLPAGLRKLIKLRHLNLNHMSRLRSISVISSLLNLETLKVYESTPLSLASLMDIKSLKNLQVLSVTIREDYYTILERLLSIPRLASCIQGLCVDSSDAIDESVVSMEALASLHRLVILSFNRIIVDWRNTIPGCVRPSEVYFQNLKSVSMFGVCGVEDLTWLLFAQSLTTLNVSGPAPKMQEIISRKKAAGILNEQHKIIPFPKLDSIYLGELEELTSIYWEPLPLPCLTVISVNLCPKLKKFPFNKESSKGNQIFVYEEEWSEGVEWEDGATKERFFLSRQVLPECDYDYDSD